MFSYADHIIFVNHTYVYFWEVHTDCKTFEINSRVLETNEIAMQGQ